MHPNNRANTMKAALPAESMSFEKVGSRIEVVQFVALPDNPATRRLAFMVPRPDRILDKWVQSFGNHSLGQARGAVSH